MFKHKEPKRSLIISFFEGGFVNIHVTILQSSLISALALYFGAKEVHLGIIAALITLSSIGSITGASLIAKGISRKSLATYSTLIGRSLMLILAILPFINLQNKYKLMIIALVIFLGGYFINIAVNAWLSWMKDLVPNKIVGNYFGIRSAFAGFIGMLTSLLTGIYFDFFRNSNNQPLGFCIIFSIGVLASLASAFCLSLQYEPKFQSNNENFIVSIFNPLKNKNFRTLIIFTSLWTGIIGIGSPFWVPHMIKNLDMNFTQISYYFILYGVAAIFSQIFGGKLADKIGNKPLLTFSIIVQTLMPVLWIFPNKHFYLPIWLDGFISGIFLPIIILTQFNLVLKTAPEKSNSYYYAVQTMIAGFMGFLFSFGSGIIAQKISDFKFVTMGLTLVNYHIVFLSMTVLRILLFPLVLYLHEPKHKN